MYIQQVSVFLENEDGKLQRALELLGENRIDIRALSLADTTHFGVLRIIVDHPDRAVALLREACITASVSEVIGVGMTHAPGSLADILHLFKEEEIGVEYAYAFLGNTEFPACVIMRATDNARAVAVLKQHGVRLLDRV